MTFGTMDVRCVMLSRLLVDHECGTLFWEHVLFFVAVLQGRLRARKARAQSWSSSWRAAGLFNEEAAPAACTLEVAVLRRMQVTKDQGDGKIRRDPNIASFIISRNCQQGVFLWKVTREANRCVAMFRMMSARTLRVLGSVLASSAAIRCRTRAAVAQRW